MEENKDAVLAEGSDIGGGGDPLQSKEPESKTDLKEPKAPAKKKTRTTKAKSAKKEVDKEDMMDYIIKHPHRNALFTYMSYGAFLEIDRLTADGKDWKDDDVIEESQFKHEFKVLKEMLEDGSELEIMESRNGRIFDKETLEKGNFYFDFNPTKIDKEPEEKPPVETEDD